MNFWASFTKANAIFFQINLRGYIYLGIASLLDHWLYAIFIWFGFIGNDGKSQKLSFMIFLWRYLIRLDGSKIDVKGKEADNFIVW